MKKTCLLLISLFIYSYSLLTHAQEAPTGQICVRAFEDINANQIRDQGEIPIQANLIANLLDSEGVIIDSQLIEDSPTRSQGLICFRDLAPNNYSITVTSVAYLSTTSAQLNVTLADGDLPVVMEYGGETIISQEQTELAEETPTTNPTLERLIVASIGALIAMVIWVGIGGVILLIIVRPRALKDEAEDITDLRFKPPTDPNMQFRPPPPTDENYEL